MIFQIYHLTEGWVSNLVVATSESDIIVPEGFGVREETPDNLYAPRWPAIATATRREQLAARISERRYQVEIGGTIVGGIPIATDDRSKFLLNTAADRAVANPSFTVEWKVTPAMWVTLDAAMLSLLKNAVFDHVSACFAKERALLQQLNTTADADLDAFAATVEAFQLS